MVWWCNRLSVGLAIKKLRVQVQLCTPREKKVVKDGKDLCIKCTATVLHCDSITADPAGHLHHFMLDNHTKLSTHKFDMCRTETSEPRITFQRGDYRHKLPAITTTFQPGVIKKSGMDLWSQELPYFGGHKHLPI